MTTLIIISAFVGAAALRAGGIISFGWEPVEDRPHEPSVRRLPGL